MNPISDVLELSILKVNRRDQGLNGPFFAGDGQGDYICAHANINTFCAVTQGRKGWLLALGVCPVLPSTQQLVVRSHPS